MREGERTRARKKRDADLSDVNKAQSFRLGEKYMEMLRKTSRKTDRSQVAIIRRGILSEYTRVFEEGGES